jgi:hypothetical protein
MKEVNTIVTLRGKRFPAHAFKCVKCGEEEFSGEEVEKIRKMAMKEGLWGGTRMKRRLQKIGRATAVYIPADISKQLKLKPRQEVAISVEDHKMIIEPLKKE